MKPRIWKFLGSKAALAALSALLVPLAVAVAAGAANVTGVGFTYQPGKSKFEITFDHDVEFEKNVSESDKQVVLDVKNAKIAKKFKREFDTSSYKSNVSIIKPYQSGDNVRVTFQLIENGSIEVSKDGKKLVAMIDNKQAVAETTDAAAPLTDADKQVAKPDAAQPVQAEATPEPSKPAADAPATTTAGSNDALDRFFEAAATKHYVGKPIDLQVRDVELPDVFTLISEASEFNIVLDDKVKGKIMLNLNQVPWDQALDLILKSYRLAAERQGNILRVTTIDNLTSEKKAEAEAAKAKEQAEPLVVKIFPISYANIGDLRTILNDFLTQDAAAQNAQKRGTIQIDNRTNSLVIRDTPSSMEKIKRIVKELDTQTPQILIEGKFVSVSEQNSKEVQGRIFGTTREFDATAGSFIAPPAKNNFSGVFGGAGTTVPATGFAVTVPDTGGAGFGFMPKAGLIPGLSEIGAFLNILESEARAKTIASPRVITQNKTAATISQGTTVQIPVPGGANVAGGFQTVNLTLQLTVTPQVTNEGSVLLKIDFTQSTLAPTPPGAQFASDSKGVQTNVIVDSGGTLVIGGIYQSDQANSEAGIPVLRDLPILGPFFGSKKATNSKSELFIFLTPRIINEREAGLKG